MSDHTVRRPARLGVFCNRTVVKIAKWHWRVVIACRTLGLDDVCREGLFEGLPEASFEVCTVVKVTDFYIS